MADDVVGLLDTLHMPKADVVGWSDGAILGLDLALRHPDRVGRIFAFAANTQTSGVQDGVDKNPTFARYHRACRPRICPAVGDPEGLRRVRRADQQDVGNASRTGPTRNSSRSRSPVLVVDGDHDEAIRRGHTEYIAATIPGAGLLILPNVSHFAFLQDPVLFNDAILHFLGDRVVPRYPSSSSRSISSVSHCSSAAANAVCAASSAVVVALNRAGSRAIQIRIGQRRVQPLDVRLQPRDPARQRLQRVPILERHAARHRRAPLWPALRRHPRPRPQPAPPPPSTGPRCASMSE